MGGPDHDKVSADLVNAAMISQRLDIAHPETVFNWVRRDPTFPAPVFPPEEDRRKARRGQVHIWLWSEVRAWAIETGRLPPDA